MTGPGERYAKIFKYVLQTYRKPDGEEWRGVDLEEATNGFVTGSYITGLKRGRITRPGLDKLRALAEVMGFPFYLWLQDPESPTELGYQHTGGYDETFADRLNYLFEVIKDDQTGEKLSNAYVARMSRGRLSEETIKQLRDATFTNPGRRELLALCDVFDIDFSYWDLKKERPPLMSISTLQALRDSGSYAILHQSVELPDDDKDLIINMMDHLQQRRTKNTQDHS